MTTLEFIVKEYRTSYTEIAKKIGLSASTVTDWGKGRRPIPKTKLSILSKLFGLDIIKILDEKLYVKELDEIEKINIRLEYLNQSNREQTFKIPTTFQDNEGNLIEGYYWAEPYENEIHYLNELLKNETLKKDIGTLLKKNMVSVSNNPNSKFVCEIFEKCQNFLDENINGENLTSNKIKTLNYLLKIITENNVNIYDENENGFSKDLTELLTKYNFIW